MPRHTQVEGFQTQVEQKGILRRLDGTQISHELDGRLGNIGSLAEAFAVGEPVIGGIRFRQTREFILVRFPVKVAAVHNHAAHGGGMAVHVLGGGVGDDIRTPFKRTAINGRGKGIVHNEGNAVRMGNVRHFTDIQHAKRGIGNSLRKESFRIGAERFGDFLRRSVLVHESNFNAHFPECDGKEVVCAPVNRRSTDDMIPSLANIENGKEGSRLAGRRQNGGHTALQFGNFSGNRLIAGVLEACIKESGFFQIKQFCHLFAGLVLERRALVNGQYAGFALFRRPARLHAQGLRSQFLIHHAGHAMRCHLPCKAGKTRRMDKFAPAPPKHAPGFFPV